MTAPAEGPATVTPPACLCGLVEGACPAHPYGGPATVTLTRDELRTLAVAHHGRLALTDDQLAAVESIVAARVAALTADLATADANVAAANRRWCASERVIANVRAMHNVHHWCGGDAGDFYMVDGETGTPWPCPTLALLPAAPTGEGKTDG